MIHRLKRVLSGIDAATAVEYAVMLALVLLIVLGAVTLLGTRNGESWDNINANLSGFGFGS